MKKNTSKIWNFEKMQGLGNDYIYFDCLDEPIENMRDVAKRLSNRNFGIGGDGVVFICPSQLADAKMRMFNADGSEAEMCGNAIRCVAKLMYDSGRVDKKRKKIDIGTLSGVKNIALNIKKGVVQSAKVNMGKPILDASKIPANFGIEEIISHETKFGGIQCVITCVSMGNPHCVVFVDTLKNFEVEKIGKLIENDPRFPQRANIEFVEISDEKNLKMRVWERGSGETLSCGTGACASVVAAVLNGYCQKNEDITVELLGGNLVINYTNDTVFMTGEATHVFSGTIEI
ncbi:MAG: diaminopimelate epimerase [Firmicutes bacterium]|nr:diaminopimelate epimerase [Bacillota bacterium]